MHLFIYFICVKLYQIQPPSSLTLDKDKHLSSALLAVCSSAEYREIDTTVSAA